MAEAGRARYSLRRRIIVSTLLIFLASIWALSYYASRMLREDMERLLADQQSSTLSYVAAELNHALEERVIALEEVARSITPSMLSHPDTLQQFLEYRPVFQDMFNSGVIAVSLDGTAIADVPVVAGRRGTNYASNAATRTTLTKGKTVIGRPLVGRVLKQPLFNINAPIVDARGKVIGALFGVINLAKSNFLDRIGEHRYGKSGGYLVMDLENDLIVTATDKTRVLQTLPAPGTNEMMDRRRLGFVGSAVSVNSLGEEVLSSASRIPASNWMVVAALPTKEAFAPIRDMQRRIMLAAFLLTLIAGALSWWLLRRLFAPLLAAVESLARMSVASNPLQPLPLVKHDEIGQLVGGFNQLLATLGQHEAQLKTERDFFSAVLHQSSDGVLLFDPDDFSIREANPSVCHILGYTRDELLALKYSDLLAEDREIAMENVQRIRHGKTPFIGERQFRNKDGAAIAVEVSASLVETGGRQLIMGSLRDRRERKRTEAELQRHREHLEEIVVERTAQLRRLATELTIAEERERRSIAQDLHDDLGQILSIIKLRLTSLNIPGGKEWAGDLMQQVLHIEGMVDQANRSVHSLSIQLSPPMLSESGLVPALEWLSEEMLHNFDLIIRIYCDGPLPSLDDTLNSLLFRIVRELLINVSKHAMVGAAEVSVVTDGDNLVLTVSDDGVGFDGKRWLAPSADGGYGLFSVRERVTYFGGDMQIDSQPGHGTMVVMTLPLDTVKRRPVR
ncbi:MAG: PAS domain S-box protein [Proteobacteria bacterium]|nr:PAS domain S-box protein [Pseudomonadota bacterium]